MSEEKAMSTFAIDPEGLAFIFEHTKDAPAKQAERVDALDGKIVQVFSAASIILGFGAITAVRDATTSMEWALVAFSMAAYLVVAVATAFALWPREWRDNTHAIWLWQESYHRSPNDIRHILVDDLKSVMEHNERGLKRKARAIEVAIVFTGIEVALMIASLVISSA